MRGHPKLSPNIDTGCIITSFLYNQMDQQNYDPNDVQAKKIIIVHNGKCNWKRR